MLLIASALLLAQNSGSPAASSDPRLRIVCRTFEEELRDVAHDRQKLRAALARFGPHMIKIGCRIPPGLQVPASTVTVTEAVFQYRLPGERRTYRSRPPLMARPKRPSPPVPTPVPEAEPPAGEHDSGTAVEDILITAIVVPDAPSCDGPAAGWIGLVDTNDPDPAVRRVQFDSSPPVYSSAARNTVPGHNDRLEFSSQFPAQIFASLTPCYSDDRCKSRPMSGTFRIVSRVSFPAGPRGYLRWQLCVLPIVKSA